MNRAELVKTLDGIIRDYISDIKLPRYVKSTQEINKLTMTGGCFNGVTERDFLNVMQSAIMYEIEEVIRCVDYNDLSQVAGSVRGRAEAWYKDGVMAELFGQGIYEILCKLADVLDPEHKAKTIKPKTETIEAKEFSAQLSITKPSSVEFRKPIKTKPAKPAVLFIAPQNLKPAKTVKQSPQPEKITALLDSDEKLEKLADSLLAFYEEHGTVIDEETWKFLPDFSKILRDAGFNDSIIKTNASYIRADILDKNKANMVQTLRMMLKQQKEYEETATPTQSSLEAYS